MAKFFVFLVKMNVWMVWNLYIFLYFFLRHVLEHSMFCIFERAISLIDIYHNYL